MQSFAQENLRGCFQALRDDVFGKKLWVGDPNWVSFSGVLAPITDLDPRFELTRDIRECCKLIVEDNAPDLTPDSLIIDGDSPLHPESRWRVLPGSRSNNPLRTTVSYVVRKVVS